VGAYTRYSQADMPLLKRVGGTVLWAGHVEVQQSATSATDVGIGWSWSTTVAGSVPLDDDLTGVRTCQRRSENAIEDHVILAAKSYSKLLA
jgi:hypothetical protein